LAIFGYDLATAFAVKSYRCVLGYDRFLVEFGLLLIRELGVFLSSVSDVGLTGSIAFKLARGLQETFLFRASISVVYSDFPLRLKRYRRIFCADLMCELEFL
jgi:hypothetical protein